MQDVASLRGPLRSHRFAFLRHDITQRNTRICGALPIPFPSLSFLRHQARLQCLPKHTDISLVFDRPLFKDESTTFTSVLDAFVKRFFESQPFLPLSSASWSGPFGVALSEG